MASSISSPLIAPEADSREQSRRELQAKLTGLGGLNGRNLSPEAREKKLREACEGFESIFIQKMWQEMRNTIPKGGMMHGKEERFWQDMYDQELSKSMTKAGGIGLADMMVEQLSRNLVSASRSAVATATGGAFTPSAPPLVVENHEEQMPAPASKTISTSTLAASIYDGEAPQAGVSEETPQAAEVVQPVAVQHPAAPKQERQIAAVQPDSRVSDAGKTKNYSHHYPDGQNLARIAMRDAGDKLGSRAVRPPLHKQRAERQKQAVQPEPQQQAAAPQPGSADALRAALDSAKTGATPQWSGEGRSLTAMVASVQANNAAAAQAGSSSTQQVAEAAQSQQGPVVRKTRFTTNIPPKERAKRGGQPIRMLNVDNVSHNSKAGKGLAAYHAAQESARAQESTAQAETASPAQPTPAASPIQPLTAPVEQEAASFSVPPLTAGALKS